MRAPHELHQLIDVLVIGAFNETAGTHPTLTIVQMARRSAATETDA